MVLFDATSDASERIDEYVIIHIPRKKIKPEKNQSVISSETLQSSKLPSGRYRRMIRGIFRCDSSFIAICKASVSPSSGTRTGAFMLPDELE